MRKIYSIFILSLFTFLLQAQDLTIKGTVTVQPDAELYVHGSVLIELGGILDIQSSSPSVTGFVEVNYETIGALGTWECNGTTISAGGDGEVYFKGDVDYDIKGTSVSFPHLILDIGTVTAGVNPSKANVIDSIHIAKTLDLKNGRMVTSADKVVYVSNNSPDAIKSSVSGFGENKSNFIQGSLRREVVISDTAYYKFPIGCAPDAGANKKGYNPAFIDLTTGINARKPANATNIVAKFNELADPGIIHYNNLAPTCYSTSTQYQFLELFWMIKEFGYWDLKPNGNPQGWWYSFYCKPDFDYIFDHNSNLTHIKVIKAPKTFNPQSTADWTTYVTESGNGCDMVGVKEDTVYWKPGPNIPLYPIINNITDSIRASELITFSRFGLGAGTGAGLPIELLYLEAHPVDNSYIQVNWATATEINNSGFEVQRSTDGVNFTTIEWVPGAGNSSTTISYGIPDRDVVPNQLYYYRLNQIDYNGTSELTYVVSAMITAASTFAISEFIPNPTENDSRIEVLTSDEKTINVTVYNTLGQIISKADQHLVPGTNRIDFDFNLLADGTYYAIFLADNQVYSRKLILAK